MWFTWTAERLPLRRGAMRICTSFPRRVRKSSSRSTEKRSRR